MTKQTSPFVLLGVGLMASLGYFYFGPKLFGSKNKDAQQLTDSPFSPFPPGGQGPPLPAVLPQDQPPMGPQTMLPPPMPPVNNQPNMTLQNGAIPMSPQGMPMYGNPQGSMMPPPYPPMSPNQNMMFSGATFPDDVGYGYGFPMAGV